MAGHRNPFAVQTPEGLPPEDVVSLFVNVFTDFSNVPKPGHTFLNGARGSGKSMMFRYLEPDCQYLTSQKDLRELDFFGIYIPIKSTDLKLTELLRLENSHADALLNEHFLTMHVTVRVLSAMAATRIPREKTEYVTAVRKLYVDSFSPLLHFAGWFEPLQPLEDTDDVRTIFLKMVAICSQMHRVVNIYLRKIAFEPVAPYVGPICGYLDFLLPLCQAIRHLPFMPRGPIYLLLDDADNLNLTQTKVLNSWVSTRTSSDISLKISTQLNYKSFRTTTGQTIDSPHDYSEVNISSVYTSSKDKYRERVWEIVRKRLQNEGIDKTPEEYFPENEEQEAKIAEIAQRIRDNHPLEGRSSRVRDDVTRYARPEYIASLQGTSRSGATYSYAGFDQLVHISSGIIRYFLECASFMHGEMKARAPEEPVTYIEPSVQNKIVREQADLFLFSEFEKMASDEGGTEQELNIVRRLRNLILALGGAFHEILVSKDDRSERRVFSIAFSDGPDPETLEVLRLGVRYGYFHESSIGNKYGNGRARLYILSRRLAPYFLLDPTSFAAHKWVTNEAIHEAMSTPQSFVRRIKNRGHEHVLETKQLNMFLEGE